MSTPTNEGRAERAKQVLEFYENLADDPAGTESLLADLLADLMHLCEDQKTDFDGALQMATIHFDDETNPMSIYSAEHHKEEEANGFVQLPDRFPKMIPENTDCHHLTGYWINEGVNFRCYQCGCQFHTMDIPENKLRKIEACQP